MRERCLFIPEEDLRSLYLERRLTQKQIADLCGCGRGPLLYWLRKYNLLRNRKRWITGALTCHVCGKIRIVRYYKPRHPDPQASRCRSCASKAASTPQAIAKRTAGAALHRSDPLIAKLYSERGRQQVLARGGIPNAVRFTTERSSGKANNRWKGGITPTNTRLRNSAEARGWRRAVFHRDSYSCQICGYRGSNLVAHHIRPWAQEPGARFDVDNGITLCGGRKDPFGCHIQIVHRGSWNNVPMTMAEIKEVQGLISSGGLSIDWLVAQ